MFRNYLKIAFRNLKKHKAYSLINISGLTVGISCCILILLYIQDEFSYDTFHENADNIYRIAWFSSNPQTRTPHPMTYTMVADFPEVVNAVSISPIWGPGLTKPTFRVEYEGKVFDEPGFFSADTTFFSVFSFELKNGDPATALKQRGGIVITEEIAEKYFGSEDPIGKTIKVNNTLTMTVTGVMGNVPDNSHFSFKFLISYVTLKPIITGAYFTWGDFGHFNYIQLAEGADHKALEAKMIEWSRKYIQWNDRTYQRLVDGNIAFRLQPMTDIHLNSHIRWELEQNGNMQTIYIFSAAALFILIIGCVNFMNLATARSLGRSKEIGMRKTFGAKRDQLVLQFLSESIIFSVIAILLSLVAVTLFLPSFNGLASKNLTLNLLNNHTLLFSLIGITAFVGFFSGSYPAVFLSSFRPIQALKGAITSNAKSSSSRVRKFLVVFQFVVAIALIVGTTVVFDQLQFLRNTDLGFNKEGIVVVPIKDSTMRQRYQNVKEELLQISGVTSVSAVSNLPGKQFNQNTLQRTGTSERSNMSEISIDYDFFTTLGVDLLEGRFFQEGLTQDSVTSFILNETAANQFTWSTAIDNEIVWYDDDRTWRGKVIGVLRDFHFKSLHQQITPLIFMVKPGEFNYFLVKINSGNVANTIRAVEGVWQSFDQADAFTYSFLDKTFEENYNGEQRMGKIFTIFSTLAIVIGCLGLLGLTAFSVEQRTKEIGIRKVLGATVPEIVKLLSADFLKLVVLANVIAWPLSYFLMRDWLENFAYRMSISPMTFIISGTIAVAIALITTSYHAIKSAYVNPTESLKYE